MGRGGARRERQGGIDANLRDRGGMDPGRPAFIHGAMPARGIATGVRFRFPFREERFSRVIDAAAPLTELVESRFRNRLQANEEQA